MEDRKKKKRPNLWLQIGLDSSHGSFTQRPPFSPSYAVLGVDDFNMAPSVNPNEIPVGKAIPTLKGKLLLTLLHHNSCLNDYWKETFDYLGHQNIVALLPKKIEIMLNHVANDQSLKNKSQQLSEN